jgi:hypothetical protein
MVRKEIAGDIDGQSVGNNGYWDQVSIGSVENYQLFFCRTEVFSEL